MARITPSTGGRPLENPVDINRVRNYDLYRARLAELDWAPSKFENGGLQLVADWELVEVISGFDNKPGRFRDYYGLKLGQMKDGKVSGLRSMLNAIAGAADQTEVSFFDDETMEWGYEGQEGPAWGQLQAGWEVAVRGKITPRNDGQGSFFKVEVYEPVANLQAQPAPPPRPTVVNQPPAMPQSNGAPQAQPFNPQPVPQTPRPQPQNAPPQPQPVGSYSGVAPGAPAANDQETPF